MPGKMVSFQSNGGEASGHLSVPRSGKGPGVVVIQEWWGLVAHIKDVADRFAGEGYTALAPDVYHGKTTTEPDEAGKLMMSMNIEQAAKDLRGACDYLRSHEASTGKLGSVEEVCAELSERSAARSDARSHVVVVVVVVIV